MQLSFPSELGFERIARDAVASFATGCGLSFERVEDLKTMVAEACINAIEHGNQHHPGLRVGLTCAYAEMNLTVEVIDHGVRDFEPGGPPATIEQKLAGVAAPRGMGLMLIACLADEAGFVQGDGKGNRFRFALRLGERSG